MFFSFVKNVLLIIDAYLSKRKVSASAQSTDSGWSARLHLLGFCLLLQAQNGLHGPVKERKIHESVRCFFRYHVNHILCNCLLHVILYFRHAYASWKFPLRIVHDSHSYGSLDLKRHAVVILNRIIFGGMSMCPVILHCL